MKDILIPSRSTIIKLQWKFPLFKIVLHLGSLNFLGKKYSVDDNAIFRFFFLNPTLQNVYIIFVEGLRLHGVLDIMKQHKEDAEASLTSLSTITSDALKDFFKPSYSLDGSDKKAVEVKVVYNFHRFLGQVGSTYLLYPYLLHMVHAALS